MKLVDTASNTTLATIHGKHLEVTDAGKRALLPYNEPIQIPSSEAPLFQGLEWIEPSSEFYAGAFWLFVTTSVMKNRTDLEWQEEPHDRASSEDDTKEGSV